jgi:L-ascorbate metabolism protein UlaG (beta-lactamase superfamily)
VGFVLELEDGFKLYYAGDTTVFGDMKLIADLYEPGLAILPIGDLYTMGPKEAALACRLLRARWVIPMHYGTSPALTGRPEQLRELTRDLSELEIIQLKPGETWNCPPHIT